MKKIVEKENILHKFLSQEKIYEVQNQQLKELKKAFAAKNKHY